MPIVIFDMDGVLYRGAQVLPYAREALDRLRRASWDVFFATNNSTATRLDYLGRLQQLGLGGDLDHIVTSGYATAHYLERRRPLPQDVLVVGADGLREEIRAVGIAVRDAGSLPGIDPPPQPAPAARHRGRRSRLAPHLREARGGAARDPRGCSLRLLESRPGVSGRGTPP